MIFFILKKWNQKENAT